MRLLNERIICYEEEVISLDLEPGVWGVRIPPNTANLETGVALRGERGSLPPLGF